MYQVFTGRSWPSPFLLEKLSEGLGIDLGPLAEALAKRWLRRKRGEDYVPESWEYGSRRHGLD